MALIRWEPVPVNRLFNSLFDTPTVATAPVRRFAPATDLVETDSSYILRADLPGVSEDDITVQVDRNVLTIAGQRKSEQADSRDGYYRIERSSGSFRRSVRLPQGVDADAIQASFDRGVLEVTVPKPVQAQPHTVQIAVGSATTDAPAVDTAEAPQAPEAAAPEATEPAAA